MRIFYNLILIAIVLLLFILATPGFLKTPVDPDTINISGKWKIIYNDNTEIAKPDYNDAVAADIYLPGNWVSFLKQNDSMSAVIWLRKSVFIDNSSSNSELILDLGNIGVANEVYLNGCFIGVTGGMPKAGSPLSYRFAWKTPRYYLLPKHLIRFNDQNIISIRVFSHVISGVSGNLNITHIWDQYPYKLENTISSLINYTAIIINGFFFFFFLIQYSYNRSNKIFFYILMLTISSVFLYLSIMEIPFYINGLTRFKILFISYSSISFFLALFTQQIIKRKKTNTFALILISLYCLDIFSILFTQTTRELAVYTRLWVLICTFTFQIYAFTGLFGLIRRHWLFILTIPVCLSTIYNDYYIWIMNYDSIYTKVFIHAPILLSVYLLFMFSDYQTQIDSKETIFQSLRRKAQRLQTELHKIKKTNIKRQPNEVIHDLIDYINDNYTITYDRRMLAKKFGLNENYMVQLFKKTTGKTISEYINTKRIEKASDMLSDHEVKIIDIAYNIGFENYNHFFNCFKKSTGMSPEQYRKTVINSK